MQQGGWTRSLSILSLSLGSTHIPHKGLKSKSESLGNICWHPSLTVFTVRTPSRVVEAQLLMFKKGTPICLSQKSSSRNFLSLKVQVWIYH